MENNTVMKPMVYTTTWLYECLYEGYYKDYHFAILSMGTHPCAYIEIPENHKYYAKKYNDMDIYCHGGLTFSSAKGLGCPDDDFYRKGFWIGWDYAHCSDYLGSELAMSFKLQTYDKKWTTEEIYEEIKDVIEQLINSD